jgi:transglutaminase-like putative cysteine protease
MTNMPHETDNPVAPEDTPAAAHGTVRWRVVHTTTYDYSEPVPVCHNAIHLTPRDTPTQRIVSHHLRVEPGPTSLSRHTDVFGNQVGFFAIEEPHAHLAITATTEVDIRSSAPPPADGRGWEEIAAAATTWPGPERLWLRQFRLESPLVRCPAPVAEWAARSFTAGRPWLDALLDLTSRIHREFTYDPSATTISTPVEEVFALRRGVCQDFAHLQIACLRVLGLPARYVSGYIASSRPAAGPTLDATDRMVGADASHAWLSCWGGPAGWVDVDPTNDLRVDGQHVTVAWGRDYGDVCPIKGVYVGGGHHSMDVAVDVRPI